MNRVNCLAALCGVIAIVFVKACVPIGPAEEPQGGSQPQQTTADAGSSEGAAGGEAGPQGKDEDKDNSPACSVVDGKVVQTKDDGGNPLCDCDDSLAAVHPGADPAATCAMLKADGKSVAGRDVNCDGVPDCPAGDGGAAGSGGAGGSDAGSADGGGADVTDSGADSAESGTECKYDSDCSDGKYCNGKESCAGGKCAAGTPIVCDDGNPATTDTCEEALASCKYTPKAECKDDAFCSDGKYCNGKESCAGGKCAAGTPIVCNDGNPATTDTCEEATTSCKYTPITVCKYDSDCSNGKYCDGQEKCVGGQCAVGTPIVCDDKDPNTTDTCDEATASCKYTPGPVCKYDSDCSDGKYCNGKEKCSSGKCVAGTPIVCDDGNPATTDTCDEATAQCKFTPNTVCTPNIAYDCDLLCGSVTVTGTKVCNSQGTGYGACQYKATETLCSNGKDDDCDGKVDSVDPDCGVCAPNTTQSCTYNCVVSNQNIPGLQTCKSDGSGWLACAAAVSSEVGKCSDALDNDCDGKIDLADTVDCPPSSPLQCSQFPDSIKFGWAGGSSKYRLLGDAEGLCKLDPNYGICTKSWCQMDDTASPFSWQMSASQGLHLFNPLNLDTGQYVVKSSGGVGLNEGKLTDFGVEITLGGVATSIPVDAYASGTTSIAAKTAKLVITASGPNVGVCLSASSCAIPQ